MNQSILSGRIVKDPELRYTSNGTPVTSLRLAVDRNYKSQSAGEKETDFFDVICWRQLGENCKKYLSKGSKILVSGQIHTRTYDHSTGVKITYYEIVAGNVEFLDGVKKNNEEVAPDTASENPTNPFEADDSCPF